MRRITLTIFISLFVLSSCNYQREKMVEELKTEVQWFQEHKEDFNQLIGTLQDEGLLLADRTLSPLHQSRLTKNQQALVAHLNIHEIVYGGHMPCDAMLDELREMFFFLDDDTAIWYCPCIDQSKHNHFHENTELRAYKDIIRFHSLGLGGNWAIVQVKDVP